MGFTFLITGGSGMVGTRLTELLMYEGHRVAHLGRKQDIKKDVPTFTWDPGKHEMDPAALQDTDYIINLAGSGIADHRWTDAYKKTMYESRVSGTRLLADMLDSVPNRVKRIVSISASGYYGDQQQGVATETSPAGADFLARLCVDWEGAARETAGAGRDAVIVRTGVVLSKKGGLLEKLSAPVKLYAGAPLGDGNQLVSWIHINDLCGILMKAALDQDMNGAYNAAAPGIITNRELTEQIARKLGKPLFLPPVPGFMLKMMFGEMSIVMLASQPESSAKVQEAGYVFKYPQIDAALADLLAGTKN